MSILGAILGPILGLASTATAKDVQSADGGAPAYYDNRSTAKDVLKSYYNAISLAQFARAFSYTLRATPDQNPQELDAAYTAFKDQFEPVS